MGLALYSGHSSMRIIPIVLLFSTLGAAGKLSFNRDIRPILSNKCYACHGPDSKTREAKLRLDQRESALKVIEPGAPDKSELIARIAHLDAEEIMPPPETNKSLSPKEIRSLRKWIEEGAQFEPHWAFIPATRKNEPRNIDHFIIRRLQDSNLTPSSPAPKVTLIRRVSLDLTGIPASPEEVRAFVDDSSPDAYEKLIDRLLASPRYGEHMAAFWMEASRYADTDGYQNDRYRYHWAWRDWLIRALNQNLPYDKFITHQLAGDMLPNTTLHQQIATGFCRNHRINSEAGSIPEEWQAEYVADRVDTLGTVFLGLTVSCARCHDHKFDPISQKEYYQLFAYFNNVPEFGTGPNNGNSPPYIPFPKDYPNIDEATNKARTPEPITWQKKGQYNGGVRRPVGGKENTVMIMHEQITPRETYLLNRGLYNDPDKSEKLQPSTPASLKTSQEKFEKNRLGLAQWLTHPKHPLTSRVAVNRYWQHFFGAGLVRTPENFGAQGEVPTHPELLDWLAVEFIENGWNVKALHKLIAMSTTYQQSSLTTSHLLALDPDNRLLARAPRLRLTAFAIRDQALFASNLLVEKQYGPPAKPYMPPKIWSAISNNKYKRDTGDNLYRRSLYTYWRRTIPPPTMMTFNAGDREVCTIQQSRTNTPLQALTLMNNVAFVEASRFLAERMLRTEGSSTEKIAAGYRVVSGRAPSKETTERLAQDYEAYRSDFANTPDKAAALLKIGDKAYNQDLNPTDLAAMTIVATTILNLDESLTRE